MNGGMQHLGSAIWLRLPDQTRCRPKTGCVSSHRDRLSQAAWLDLNVLQRSGGSLVVESQMIEAKGSFKVHWAGQRTAADSGNCGSNADLILSKRELRVLASAAGGYESNQQRDSFFIK